MSGFMRRIIGREAKRVSTVLADVLRISGPFGQEMNEVARDHADGRMADLPHLRLALEKRMPAEAGIFLEPISRRHMADSMSEQPAQVADLLLERRRGRIRVVLRVEQQWVAALAADVFMTPVAVGELLVIVLAEEAREGMPHSGGRSVLGEVIGAAPALPSLSFGVLEDMVIDVMAPEETRQFG
jgi:hypothetical protein